ncbi:hypothetical protein AVEN_70921-1 [Araneus ventricosus]|uniref:Uncharacterized protein n=1 Tax=Araneus ventricosus TaxID=182803 RepID=A0A4Y2RJJ4_ARAVE|nr:hypothetical protein AVEN_70921-1 [Araneus ventricosus]
MARLFCSVLCLHCWDNCDNRKIQVINSDEDDDNEPMCPIMKLRRLYLCMLRKTQMIFQKILEHKLQSEKDKVKRLVNAGAGRMPCVVPSWEIGAVILVADETINTSNEFVSAVTGHMVAGAMTTAGD